MGRTLLYAGLSLSPLLLSLFLSPGTEATAPLVVGTATVLTANQIGALIAIGLAIKAVTLKAGLLAAASRRRGRREVEPAAREIYDIETIVELEEEDCFKRIFCAAATGKYVNYSGENVKRNFDNFLFRLENIQVSSVLQLLEKDLTRLNAPLSRGAEKFLTAAKYGELSGSVEKCENRYQCPLKIDVVQTLFQ